MTGLRDFHTSVFDFATRGMAAVESQRGGSELSCQVTATIAFGESGESGDISIACTVALNTGHRRCVVVLGSKATSTESRKLEAYGKVRSRAGPPTQPIGRGDHCTKPATRLRRIYF
jgi:hypothetical protein